MQHPGPHLGRHHGRNRPGNQHGGPHQRTAGEAGIQHQRDDNAEYRLEEHRDQGEQQRVPDCRPPQRIGQNAVGDAPALRQEVLEADKAVVAEARQLRIGQAEIEGAGQRPGGNQRQYQQHRRQKQPGGTDARTGQIAGHGLPPFHHWPPRLRRSRSRSSSARRGAGSMPSDRISWIAREKAKDTRL